MSLVGKTDLEFHFLDYAQEGRRDLEGNSFDDGILPDEETIVITSYAEMDPSAGMVALGRREVPLSENPKFINGVARLISTMGGRHGRI